VNGERLEQLLRNADGFGPDSFPARSARELAEAVRLRHRRQQARRARTGAAAAAMFVACVALSGWLIYQPPTRQSAKSTVATTTPVTIPPAPAINSEQARVAFRQLVAEADRHELIAAQLQDVSPPPRARSSSVARSIDLQREEATLLLLHQGDALSHDPALRDSAAVAYRQAADLFPETSGAAAAKQRLDTLN
jgi:hypothetical protein